MRREILKTLLPALGFVLLAGLVFTLISPLRSPGKAPKEGEGEEAGASASSLSGREASSRRRAPERFRKLRRTDPAAPSPSPASSPGPLTIATVAIPLGVAGSPYSLKLEALGVRGRASWILTAGALPPGLVLGTEGIIRGTPETAGEWRFSLAVADSSGATARRDYRMIVRASGGETLEILTSELAPAELGRDYRQDLSASGGVPPLAWSVLAGSLPSDLRLHPARGIIYGLPREAGEFAFSLQLHDSAGAAAAADYTLTVREGDFRVLTAALPPAVLGELYELTLRAEGGAPPYAWKIPEGTLPPGIALDPGRGLLRGKPSAEGEFRFTAGVSDSAGREASAVLTLSVTTEPPPGGAYGVLNIVTGDLAVAVRGVPYSQQLEVSGGTPPYVWTVSLFDLPPSLFLKGPTGEIAGIPEKPGIFPLRILVSDRDGLTAQRDFQLTVNYETVRLYGLVPGDTDRVEVRVGGEYRFLVGATGGQEPYSFELAGGSLPDYLALDGESGAISGTVSEHYSAPELFVFRVKVADQAGSEITGEYKMDVLVAPTPTPSPRPSAVLPSPTARLTPSPVFSPTPDSVPTPAPTPEWSDLTIGSLSGSVRSATVGLGWVNPGGDFEKVLVVRRFDRFPENPEDGETFPLSRAEAFLDQGLADGRACYYAVLAHDRSGRPGRPGAENTIVLTPRPVALSGPNDPYADRVIDYSPLDRASGGNPNKGLGAPQGAGSLAGSLDVVSLHAAADQGGSGPCGGSITLKFDNLVMNRAGADFSVFENAFYIGGREDRRWMEPAVVYVSQNGVDWRLIPFNYFPTSDLSNPYNYLSGFAGVEPVFSRNGHPDPTNPAVSGGDQFDLNDIGLEWIQYVKILSTGDNWLSDRDGDRVRHADYLGSLSGSGASGFDLDALCAVGP